MAADSLTDPEADRATPPAGGNGTSHAPDSPPAQPPRPKSKCGGKQPGSGRPRREFDLKEVERLGTLGCSNAEMAAALGAAESTIAERNAVLGDFRLAYKRGFHRTQRALRSKQIELAMKGDRTMLIWLGKQLLAQKDVVETEHSGDQTMRIEIVTVPAGQGATRFAFSEVAPASNGEDAAN